MIKRHAVWFVSVLLLSGLMSCDDGSSSNSKATPLAEITSVTLPTAQARAGYMFLVDYNIEADETMEDVFVSFYLHAVDNADAGHDDVAFKVFLAGDIIDVLTPEADDRRLEIRIPSDTAPGDYYLDVYVNEDLEGENNKTPQDYRAGQVVTVDGAGLAVTGLRIVDMELENTAVILDPYIDFLRGMDVENLLTILTSSMAAERNAWISAAIEGLVSEAEINGSITVAVDGLLPASPLTLAFEYSLDGGVTWHALEWWDNTAQAYLSAVEVAFPDYENGTYEQTMDFDINIAYTLLNELFTYISENGLAGLEGYKGWMTRVRFAGGGSEVVEELTLPLYTVPISLGDLALIMDYMDVFTTCLEDVPTCIALYGGGLPLPTGLDALKTGIETRDMMAGSMRAAQSRADETLDRVSEKSWDRWSGRRSRIKIGADYQHKFAIYNGNPREGYYGAYAKMAFEAPLYVFNHKANLIDAYARVSAYIERPESDELRYTGYQYYLKLFADTVFWGEQWGGNFSVRAGSIDPVTLAVRSPGSALYREPLEIQKKLVTTTFMVGPVPFYVEAGVTGSIDFGLSLNVDQTNGIKLTSAFPKAAVKLYAEGGPEIVVTNPGIGVNLGIFDDTLTSSIEFDFSFDENQMRMTGGKYEAIVQNDLKTIWGELYLYYKTFVCKPPEGLELPDCDWKRKQRTLYKTDAYRDWSYTLYSQSQTLFEY